jgi:DNA-binding NtrC family response regulator
VPTNQRKARSPCEPDLQTAESARVVAPFVDSIVDLEQRSEVMAGTRGRILIVDDEANARTALADLLRDEGYTIETAADGFKALPKLEDFSPDLLLTDLRMPGMDGLDLLRKTRDKDPETAAVVMTAHGAVDTAVAAMQQGAADYLTKPINVEELVIVIDRALERRRLRREAGLLRARLSERFRIQSIVGSSPPMQKVFETVLQVAPSRASVLVTGESGTGKELIAAAIHEHSPRAAGPFVKLHCAALAETLLESELFGHERGSFTGAAARRDGRFQQADGGTLFLDEIGEISGSVQVKLLRFLQEREFERVGGNQTIKVDVRIVAATNRDLMQRVKDGRFREDLFYRLNVVSIEVPPLRYRPSDIPLLATHFLRKYAAEDGKALTGFSDEALERITRYAWPGNVRELENAIERAVVVCRGAEILESDLAPSVVAGAAASRDGLPTVPGATLAELERYAILRTLEHTGGSTSRAAEMLGISPRKIQYRLREYSGDVRPRNGGRPLDDDPVADE